MAQFSGRNRRPLIAALILAMVTTAAALLSTAGPEPGGGRPWKLESEAVELSKMVAQRGAVEAAPGRHVPAGAYAAGARASARMAARKPILKEDGHTWHPYGQGPLRNAEKDYAGVNGLGLVNVAGRPTDLAYDADHNRVYASFAYGGVWRSDDLGQTWASVGDKLPTQVVGSVGYSSANGGTLIAITGDGSFGRSSLEGMGAYRSTNGGRTWRRSKGVPSNAFGFNVAVDPTNQSTVYVATGAGLFRSTDAGATFTDVKLPTGDCAGQGNRTKKCRLANIVTDVVVQAPGGSGQAKGGKVLAAVGWRGGSRQDPDGTVQAPANGLYFSDTGAPGSFQPSPMTGFASQEQVGRVEFGPVTGAEQDHEYLYATVQDAVLDRDGTPGIDIGPNEATQKVPTEFNGIYVSSDFGQTWRLMEDGTGLQNPASGSSLAVVFQATGAYGPGVQAWYDQFVAVDPTRQAGGVPTQVLFGLEEVWRNEQTSTPQAGPSSFRVVGRYFSGRTCLGIEQSPCPFNREDATSETTTTHPDQHTALWIPQKDGSAVLLVGNDGGIFVQRPGAGGDVVNSAWGNGAQGDGDRYLQTLLPYDAAMAKDGTVWMGLQDNGTAKITPEQRQIAALGGDGFFVGVDPDNANVAYGEYVEGAMSATSDGGKTWAAMSPPITNAQFSNPFSVDPHDADHILTAGRQVVVTGSGAGTSADDWIKVFDLGTVSKRGDKEAVESEADPANSMTATALDGVNAYVGFCGVCDVLNSPLPFKNGLATNVGGSEPGERYGAKGWHFATAAGLPNRYITSIAIDPKNPRTVWVTLGGYSRPWTHPGIDGPAADGAGGHLYVSTDAGEHFKNFTKNLPDAIANWVTLRKGQPIVATDVGVFRYAKPPKAKAKKCKVKKTKAGKKRKVCPKKKPKTKAKAKATTAAKKKGKAKGKKKAKRRARFEFLGKSLPHVRVSTVRFSPGDPNLLVAATYGRGVWTYRFGKAPGQTPPSNRPGSDAGPNTNMKVASFDFEVDEQGWTVTGEDPMRWNRRPPGNASSTSFQVLPYTDDGSTVLRSPELTLPQSSTVKVTWASLRDTEPCCDYLSIDWSSDGSGWHNAGSLAGQNEGFPAFSDESVSFKAPAGKLFVRFRMTADALVSAPAYKGVAVDDVRITR